MADTFQRLQDRAEELVVPNAFGSMLQQQVRGVGRVFR